MKGRISELRMIIYSRTAAEGKKIAFTFA